MLQKDQEIIVRDPSDVRALEQALHSSPLAAKFALKLPPQYRDEGELENLLVTAASQHKEVNILQSHLEPEDRVMLYVVTRR